MKLKTSTRISLIHTLITNLFLLGFSILIFTLFFNSRYYKQEDKLLNNGDYLIPFFIKNFPHHNQFFAEGKNINTQNFHHLGNPTINNPETLIHSFSKNIKQDIAKFDINTLNSEAIVLGINKGFLLNLLYPNHATFIYYNGRYYMYKEIINDEIKAIDISMFILSQWELGQILILWNLIFLVIIFVTSMYFTERGLKKLKNLADYAANLNIDNLSLPIEIEEKAADNDEVKLISNALNTSLQRINSQVSSLRDFISNASHELKTPLMMMNTEIDVAMKKKDYENHLKNLKVSTKRIADLVDSLSLITRIESNTNLEKKLNQILPICENTINQIKKIYPHTNIEIRELEQGVEKELHEGLFSVIIKNLIENACKYAGENIKINIQISKESLIINDNGMGIKESDIPHLFDRFRQKEKDEQGKSGFGLGLYLVKKITELHGRKINVKSKPNKGTTFTIKR